MDQLDLSVRDLTGLARRRPVSGGVPLAEGATRREQFALADAAGRPVAVQSRVLARWPDGSARWVLLDFAAEPPPHGEATFRLTWSAAGEGAAEAAPAVVSHGDRVVLADRVALRVGLVDHAGRLYRGVLDSFEPEAAGPVRWTWLGRGAVEGDEGRWFQLRLRVSVWAGSTLAKVEPLILLDLDHGVMHQIRELTLAVEPLRGAQGVDLGGAPGWSGTMSGVRLMQHDDQRYTIDGAGLTGTKAPGWAEVGDGQGTVAVALRDFWQQWPKSLEVTPRGLALGLFPRFAAGAYDALQPATKYNYLFADDTYRLRTGQARRWEVWLDLDGDGEALAAHAAAPLVAAADPAQAIATGVWDAIAPAGAPGLEAYDAWAERLFEAYQQSIVDQRDYGAMNWGDWYGERYINWGNHEYDTADQLLIQFARTADPRYYHVAEAAARHSCEVDTVNAMNDDLAAHLGSGPNYPPRPGLVHQHTVGHVSGFYPREVIRELMVEHEIEKDREPYLCLDAYNLGHLWTQGSARFYFLSGDAFARETVERIGGNLAQLAEDRQYKFMGHNHCGRTTGWSLLALAGAYELDFGERYRQAMKLLVDDALAEQDPHCGGWLYTMSPGHCDCRVKHVGMAGFITAVLVNGLSRYAILSRDPELPAAIERAVTCLTNDTWREEWSDWRYTPCPATKAMTQMGVIVMAYVNAVRLAGNVEHRRILERAWSVKLQRLLRERPGQSFGKEYTSTMYGCAEASGLLLGG